MRYAVVLMGQGSVNVADEYLPKCLAKREASTINRICRGTRCRAMVVPQPVSKAIRIASLKSRSA
jgi:hypothetical protein